MPQNGDIWTAFRWPVLHAPYHIGNSRTMRVEEKLLAMNLSLVPILHVFSKSSISVDTLEFALRWRGSKRSEHHITKYITGEGGALFAPPFFVDGSIIQA